MPFSTDDPLFYARILAAFCLFTAVTAPALRAQDIVYYLDNGSVSGVLSGEDIMALPPAELRTTTSVTQGVQHLEGVLMRDVLGLLNHSGDIVTLAALNGYEVRVPTADFLHFDVILAHSMNGRRLTPRNKGPWWIVYPRDDHEELQDIRYDTRWVWQLNRLEIP